MSTKLSNTRYYKICNACLTILWALNVTGLRINFTENKAKPLLFVSKLKESQHFKHRALWYQVKEYTKSKYLGRILDERLSGD